MYRWPLERLLLLFGQSNALNSYEFYLQYISPWSTTTMSKDILKATVTAKVKCVLQAYRHTGFWYVFVHWFVSHVVEFLLVSMYSTLKMRHTPLIIQTNLFFFSVLLYFSLSFEKALVVFLKFFSLFCFPVLYEVGKALSPLLDYCYSFDYNQQLPLMTPASTL